MAKATQRIPRVARTRNSPTFTLNRAASAFMRQYWQHAASVDAYNKAFRAEPEHLRKCLPATVALHQKERALHQEVVELGDKIARGLAGKRRATHRDLTLLAVASIHSFAARNELALAILRLAGVRWK